MYLRIVCSLLALILWVYFLNKKSYWDSVYSFKNEEKITECDTLYTDDEGRFGEISEMAVFDTLLIFEERGGDALFTLVSTESGEVVGEWGDTLAYPSLGEGFTILGSEIIFLDLAKHEINYLPIASILETSRATTDVATASEEAEVTTGKANADNATVLDTPATSATTASTTSEATAADEETTALTLRREPYLYNEEFQPTQVEILDGMRIFEGAFEEGYFGVTDEDGNLIPTESAFPFKMRREVKGMNRGELYRSIIKAGNPGYINNKFVVQLLHSDAFAIYEVTDDGGIERIYLSPLKYVPQIERNSDKTGYQIDRVRTIEGLKSISLTEGCIAFLYSKNLIFRFEKGGRFKKMREILCFSWSGKKLVKYILPCSLTGFSLTEDYIYGYHTNDTGKTTLLRFPINQ